ncbi:MAG: T9SS type A sorting domain-containing protein [Paludibacter sp.]|nr:T9SS type A sorting domain-containing protein [Paludibacter sp.]
MKTKILLLSIVMVLFGAVVSAQVDITPSRYVFADQPVGQYVVDAVNAGANPPVGWAAPSENFNNGYFVLAGGPAVFTSLDAVQPAAIREGINIVDLGGDVGKVLVMRGKTSTYNVGTPMGSGYAGAWFNLNFYMDKNITPVAENIRVRLVFSIVENVIGQEKVSAFKQFYISNSQNNTSPTDYTTHSPFPSTYFQATDELGDPLVNDDGEAYYDPKKWMVYEFDASVPEVAGNPARLKIDITGTAGNMTLFIKEIKFTKNATGDPVTRQMLTLNPTVTSIKRPHAKNEKLNVGIDHHQVKLFSVDAGSKVTVYNATGQISKSFTTTTQDESFNLETGFYIIRVQNKTGKIIIK